MYIFCNLKVIFLGVGFFGCIVCLLCFISWCMVSSERPASVAQYLSAFKFGKFLAIVTSNFTSVPFSLSSPSGILLVCHLFCSCSAVLEYPVFKIYFSILRNRKIFLFLGISIISWSTEILSCGVPCPIGLFTTALLKCSGSYCLFLTVFELSSLCWSSSVVHAHGVLFP